MEKILVVHTGGTIGMVRSAQGYVPKLGIVEDTLRDIRAEADLGIEIELIRLDPLIDSANATPREWNRISETIFRYHESAKAFVVTHGTDTLAYTAGALAMSLEALGKPVILTGAMVPLGEPESDGVKNLSDAMQAAASAPPGVWVQFAGQLMHGARVRKVHSHAFDAFGAEHVQTPPRRDGDHLKRHAFGGSKISVLPVAPGMSMEVLAFGMAHCDGVVLRCFGSGTVPNHPMLESALLKARQRGIPVVAISECKAGGINLGTYEAGAVLLRHEVIDGRDMSAEAAYVKLALALQSFSDLEAQRNFIMQLICGEFSA